MRNKFIERLVDWLGLHISPAPQQEVVFQPSRTPPTRRLILESSAPEPVTSNGAMAAPVFPTPGQVFAQRYAVQTTHRLSYTTYYEAVDLVCAQCKTPHKALPAGGVCIRCSAPLNPVLIHETKSPPGLLPSQDVINALLHIGQLGLSGILPHCALFSHFPRVFHTVVEHPGHWGVIVHGRRTFDEIVGVVVQIGQTLTLLHKHNFVFAGEVGEWTALMESWITHLGSGEIYLADLSYCRPLLPGEGGRQQLLQEMRFLGQVLSRLTAGNQKTIRESGQHLAEIRAIIERVSQGRYATTAALRQDLAQMSQTPVRPLKQHYGQATHPGQKHTRNEDAVLTFLYEKAQQGQPIPVGFYMVADGMGGHEAGNVASQIVYRVVTEWVMQSQVLPDLRRITRKLSDENTPTMVLSEAIQRAHEAVRQHAQVCQCDLGSTVTAVLIIGDVAAIANVGDSRTYLLREKHLQQLTQDHSLVARLVEARVITPDEARTHPRRNEIYRSLGHDEVVDVDTFTAPLQRGDWLILCCDGLWEMVLDDEIQRIVEASSTPQQACDELVRAANRAGGDDNISVIVVKIE